MSNYHTSNIQRSISVGKYKKLKSFNGSIAELFVFYYPLSQSEIASHYEDGLNELETGGGFFIQKMIEKDEADFNRQNFAATKKIPEEVLKQVDVAPTFFKEEDEPTNSELNDRVEGEDAPEEEDNEQQQEEIMFALDEFIINNPLITDKVVQIARNYDWILSVASKTILTRFSAYY